MTKHALSWKGGLPPCMPLPLNLKPWLPKACPQNGELASEVRRAFGPLECHAGSARPQRAVFFALDCAAQGKAQGTSTEAPCGGVQVPPSTGAAQGICPMNACPPPWAAGLLSFSPSPTARCVSQAHMPRALTGAQAHPCWEGGGWRVELPAQLTLPGCTNAQASALGQGSMRCSPFFAQICLLPSAPSCPSFP